MASRPSALAAAALLLATLAAGLPPAQAQAASSAVQLKVYDAAGNTLLYSASSSVPAATLRYFAVATAGYNDPGSNEGRVAIDDLRVTRTDASESTDGFALPPLVRESTTGGSDTALRHDAAGQRLYGVANSGYRCSTNYQAIEVAGGAAAVERVRFSLTRATGSTGDGSFWDLYVGLVPSLAEAVVGAACGTNQHTGTVPTLTGLFYGGDGNGVRNDLRGYANGAAAATVYHPSVGTTYIVDLLVLPPPTPGAPNVASVTQGPAARTATVAWSAVAGATGYDLATSTDGAAWSDLGQLGAATAYTVTGLDPGPHLFRVRAQTAAGPTAYGSALTGRPPDPMPAPRSVTHAFGRVIDEEVVTWTDPVGGGATAFNVYGGAAATLLATVPATVHSYTFNRHLVPAPTHVAAVNAEGPGARSAIPALATSAGFAPGDVDATATTATGGFLVNWTAPGVAPTGFKVYRAASADATSWALAANLGPAARSTPVSVGSTGTRAFFKVTATFSGGIPESQASAIVAATSMAQPYCSANPACALVVNQPPAIVPPATPLAAKAVVGASVPIGVTASDPREAPVPLAQLDDAISVVVDLGDGTRDSCGWLAGTTFTCTVTHAWREAGRYVLMARAQDSNGALSPWAFLGFADVEDATRPPPASGPDALLPGASGDFTFAVGDRLAATYGGSLALDVDWGDGGAHGTAALAPGAPTTLAHAWSAGGAFCVKARATTAFQTTPYGACHWVQVDARPGAPAAPSGPASAPAGVATSYAATATDADNDALTMDFDWGDGTTATVAARAGQPATASHAWGAGSYCVAARATDAAGATGPWSPCRTVGVA